MEEKLNTSKFFLVDADDFFWSGIDEFNEIEGTADYREAITFDTLDEAKHYKKTLKEDWREDFNIVKVHFEFVE